MSLFSALSSSLSGLSSVTTQMQIVSKNISNATTSGYSQQGVTLESASLGGDGGGVKITGYTRAHDDALFKTLCTSLSNEGYTTTRDDYLQTVMTDLDMNSTNSEDPALSSAMSGFTSAWSELEASPESAIAQQAVVQAGSTLVNALQSAYQKVDALDTHVKTDINASLSDLNSDLKQIADLNSKIATAANAGLSTSDLQDQRDQLVQKVASTTQITTLERSQGQIAVYTTGGYALVDGTAAQTFSYNGTNVTAASDPAVSLNNVLVGGSLQAAVDFRATTTGSVSTDAGTNVIQKLRSQLNSIISAMTTSDAGPPETFAYAYNNAAVSTDPSLNEATTFFVGTGISDFAVNPNLIDGTQTIKRSSADVVTEALDDDTRSLSADGISTTNTTYSAYVSSILTGFQEAASSVSTAATTATSQREYLSETLSNETGVDTDSETLKLTSLQNAYAACAKVLAVLQNMFDTLQNIL